MFYAKVNNGQVEQYPLSLTDIRIQMPNVSFAANVSNEELEQFGYFLVTPTDEPAFDYTKNVVRNAVSGDNGFVEIWQETAASQDEVAERVANKSNEVRAERDALLSASDWTQVADAPVNSAAWAAYRQALRNIPQQPGFPWDITWPEEV